MFLNPGFLPRSGHADSAVYWADSFANAGYPSFRFDLPGLGDSYQAPPENLLYSINAGGFAPIVSIMVKELAERYSLAGVVLMGLCAGAVTALHAAAVSQECKGVILLDPYFFLLAERTKIRNELSHWALRSRLGWLTGDLYDVLRNIRLLLHGNRAPKNANMPLIRCWTQLASAGTPILVLRAPGHKAPDTKPRVGDFDYYAYLHSLSGPRSRIEVEFVEGTNHTFTDGLGQAAVRRHGERWLNTHFPLIERENIVALSLQQGIK
jgi:pimeloyl-ACP methyl ester carboxylesterase